MKRLLFSALVLLAIAATAFTFLPLQAWQAEEDYSIYFSTKGAKGAFRNFSGDILFDSSDLRASHFNVRIEVSSISTGIGLKNRHARGEDWFNAAQYPYITFVSKNIAASYMAYTVTGDLAMHGVTREISFPFTFTPSATGGVFAGSFSVSRYDYGIGKRTRAVGGMVKLEVKMPVRKGQADSRE